MLIFSESFSTFTAAGFAPTPGAGQLDSDVWLITGMSDNTAPAFGFTGTTGDFARGVISTANPTTGGVYATPSSTAGFGSALILQPGGSDVDPGYITAKIQNTTGAGLANFTVSFDWITRNNEGRGTTLTFAYSTDGVHFTNVDAAAWSTATVATETTFQDHAVGTLTLGGVTVADGQYLYLQWKDVTIAGASGASRDEVGIDNVAVNADQGVAQPVSPTLSIAATSADHAEGDSGVTDFTFTVTRSSGTGTASVDWNVSGLGGTGQATADDFQATTGSVSFAAGETAKVVTIHVVGDTTVEGDETFGVTLSNPSSGTVLGTPTAAGDIRNDDTAPAPPTVAGTPWINEFHYDNTSTDTGEFVEIAAPTGFNLSGYSIVLYNGHDGTSYSTVALSGVVTEAQNGFGVISVPYASNGIQNGGTAAAPEADGIALVGPGGHVVEFVSYEGVFTATSGPAAGMTSTDVGVSEPGTAANTSVSRVGEGSEGDEFSWTVTTDTHGSVNAGETFAAPAVRIHVSDPTVSEGDTGDTTLTFTVTRTGLTDAFQVNYATHDGTATAGSDYDATSGVLSFATGEMSKTVQVTVHGDITFEPNETVLLNLSGQTNGAILVDSQGAGTIANDDIALVHIYDIQGAGHTSPLDGQTVITEGVVTAIDTSGSRGFWIQDEHGDGNDATSDAVFVFTGAAPTVQVGDKVQVEGVVDEYQGSDPNNLTITEVNATHIVGEGTGTITPTIIGEGGRLVPTETIDSDHLTTFNPDHDAIDFFESIEGMLVTVKNAQAVDSTYQGSTWVVSDNGADATGMNSRGGITIAANDQNPEKIQMYEDSGVSGVNASYVMGDHVGDVTGVVTYYGGNYELLPLTVGSTATAGAPTRESTTLAGDADHITIGAYNVENLDPTDPQSKFDQLGYDIAQNLGSPDIVGLEEIQDADGAGAGTDYSGAATLQKLVDAVAAAGGPHYKFVEIAPTANNANGGEPNGNIRQAFLYNADRVSFVDGSLHQISDDDPTNGDAYNNSRHPLVGDFTFHGQTLTVIDIHNYSRGGSEESFGQDQPAINSGDQRRIDQTAPVERYVQNLESTNPDAHVVVMGDFNGFQFETAQTQLETGGILTNLTTELAPSDRYSYSFEGNSQQIDNLYVSPTLLDGSQFDIVHLNTGATDARPTDHDPIVSRLLVNTAPVSVGDNGYAANEDTPLTVDAAHGVLANDTDANGDALTAVLQQGPQHGTLTLNADGSFTYTGAANYNGADSFTYVAQDGGGATSGAATVNLTVAAVNDAPTVSGPVTGAATEDGAKVTLDALAKASDVDSATLTVVNVPTALPAGVTYSADTHSFTLDPANAAYESLRAGQTQVVTVSYGVSDGSLTTGASTSWTITGANDAPTAHGDTGAVSDNQSVTLDVLANDTDIDIGDGKTIVSVSATSLGGHVSIVDGKLVYAADADGFDLLLPGQHATDSFTYTMQDASGASSTATVQVTVNGIAPAAPILGGNGNDTLTGTNGNTLISGGNGNDKVLGGSGADTIDGGNGNDTITAGDGIDLVTGGNGNDSIDGGAGKDILDGGLGNDTLIGGAGDDLLTGNLGDDRFVFSGSFGHDTIVDFGLLSSGDDKIQLDHTQFANFGALMSHAQQDGLNVVITLDANDSITLLATRLSSLTSSDFVFV
jgi:VCBS repeat-containing protein